MTGDTHTTARSGAGGDSLVFRHADRVVRLIGALYQRPRWGDRPRELDETDGRWGRLRVRAERQGRQGLPMLNLIRPAGPPGILRAVAGLLGEAQPNGVRHAYVKPSGAGATSPGGARAEPLAVRDVPVIRRLLLDARYELINSPRVRGSQPKFPLFSLVVFLMNNRRKSEEPNLEVALLRDLQELGLYWRFRNITKAVNKEIGEDTLRWKLLVVLVQAVTWLLFRASVTGRIPLLSGRYRWFLRQPHLAPEMSGTFTRFATRLTDGEWQKEAPEYVARLLVNTFLEDLRRSYRLRPWQIFRRRRMTYPVLLLDDITMTNGGYSLLRLINDVRNQVGAFDPLLVVSSSPAAPPSGATDITERGGYTTSNAYIGYRVWQNELLRDRRARRPTTWYLPLWVPGTPSDSEKDEVRQRLESFQRYVVDRRDSRPALLASRWLRLGTVVVVLAGLIAGTLTWRNAHCNAWDFDLHNTGTECIGVSDGSYDLFQPSDPTIRAVEQTVYQQNQQAATEHEQNSQRPYITLVDVQAVTSSNGTADGLTAERESLEGVAVAQWRQLSKSGTSDPIVRVLVGNAGRNMLQGTAVAQQLSAMAAKDSSLVGVVGLDMSSQPTVNTINALAEAGLPMVAATLTADDLATSNPMYFQVAPQDIREAAVAAAFADQQQRQQPGTARTVRVYYSDDASDTYSNNLRDDVLKAFQAKGFATSAVAFTPSGFAGGPTAHQADGDPLAGNAHAAGQDTCSQSGYVYFTGRGVPDYGDFLDGATQCESHAVFIGGDDVSRYVANSALREQYRGLPYYYMSLDPAPTNGMQGPERDFYADLGGLFGFERNQQQSRSLDGHAALSYDSALVMITATEYLRQGNTNLPVSAGNVWREITDIHTPHTDAQGDNNFIEGVTGAIDYGGDITRHVPMDKTMAVLQVSNGEVQPNLVGFCGDDTGERQSPWCPSGS
ncbi:MAG TPA: hypothetical protein VG756_33355 [Pseudonocardiaceae bacterium]|nr:hypothetical protein [Pseudonocardiaceae bacterium]